MSKGRKPAAVAAQTAAPAIDNELLRDDLREIDGRTTSLVEIDFRFGDGTAYDRLRVVQETRFFMAQSAEAMLEAGKRLILLKEHEPHGEFVEIAENQLNLELRSAERMMKAALKYMSPKLASKSTALSTLGKTKLFELMSQDDEALAALTEGGTVAGLSLDAIDRMTTRELRAALRAANEEKEAKDRLLAEKNTRLDELQSRPLASRTWDDTAKALIEESDALFVILQEQLARLMVVQQAMMTAEFGEAADVDRGLRACAIAFGDKLTRSAQMLSELRGMHDRTLGAFADDLDSQPLDFDAAKLAELPPDVPAGDPTLQ